MENMNAQLTIIMIYLILSHFLEVLFPFCCAISATPYMLSSTMMRGKVMNSEMTDVDRPCIHYKPPPHQFLLPHRKKRLKKVAQAIVWTLGCMGENMDILLV